MLNPVWECVIPVPWASKEPQARRPALILIALQPSTQLALLLPPCAGAISSSSTISFWPSEMSKWLR